MDHKDIKLARLERNFRHLAEEAAANSLAEAARAKQAVADTRIAARDSVSKDIASRKPSRGRAAVVAWDLGHNPVGRAYVLYRLLEKEWDVDLIGPIWSRYGNDVWGPLREDGLQIRSFHCSSLADFVPKAEVLAATRVYDIVYVCKPRLPSLYLGALIKDSSDCPMVLDVDDFELSFFKDESTASFEEISASAASALNEPYEELGTRYAQSLVPAADAVTVSNVALREKFGGHIVRHARDESAFANSPERRQAARARLGIGERDFALMFIGTPRPHKGVLELASALEEIGDPSIVFHIVGDIGDRRLRETLENHRARVVLHPNCPFEELPELLAGADLVPLIQDVEHPISQFQIPAKVSDALALGIPVLATRTPPLADLIAAGAIHATDRAGLADAIRRLRARASSEHDSSSHRARRDFVNELGMAVNRTRLELAIDEAGARSEARSDGVEDELSAVRGWAPSRSRREHDSAQRDDGTCRLPGALEDMVELVREQYRTARRKTLGSSDWENVSSGTGDASSARLATPPSRFPGIIRNRSISYDIAFFWKQNDTGLYGRRSDMIARYLVASGRVGKLMHFDKPRPVAELDVQFQPGAVSSSGQEDLILRNLVDREVGMYDTEAVRSRTFVSSKQPRRGRLLGQPVCKPENYVRFVNEQLEAAGMRASQTVAWFCPVIWDTQELIDKVGFGGVVTDLIDDQRAWDNPASHRAKQEANYRDTLKASDLVFANCDALAEAMGEFAPNIHVVPNGAERFSEFPERPVPESLRNIKGPIAGYVGNLRERIDWLLMHQVVTAMPDVSFVFFGPSGDNPNADSLAKYPNVHVLGVVPYSELPYHLRAFDVGLVPHVSNRLTEKMNPLKVYNYYAAGLPIVSSEVSNLADLGSALKTANDPDGFVRAIRASLRSPLDTTTSEWSRTMDSIAWDTRVANILTVMDRSLRGPVRKSA